MCDGIMGAEAATDLCLCGGAKAAGEGGCATVADESDLLRSDAAAVNAAVGYGPCTEIGQRGTEVQPDRWWLRAHTRREDVIPSTWTWV